MSTVTVEIKSRWNEGVLFRAEVDASTDANLRVRAAVEIAVKSGANLACANLVGASLSRADLTGADLTGADLTRAFLAEANLPGAFLAGAFLAGASLTGDNLAGANLAGARHAGAGLTRANLAGANLTRASLDGASLDGASLAGAHLSGAYLSGAYLSGADLEGGEKLIGERPLLQIGPIGSAARYFVAYNTDKGLRLRTGCFFGSREQFEARLSTTHGDNLHAQEYRAALALIDAHARLWMPKTTGVIES